MSWVDAVTVLFLVAGTAFFIAGTAGVLRFPDVHSRLHAITKADNLGLGLIVIGLAFQAGASATVIKLIIIWILALIASSTSCYLIARHAERVSAERA